MAEVAPFRYRAFLSYSHRDSAWAKWLHAALEGYRIDQTLVGRETPVGPVPATLRPIFRDREDFSAGHSLNAQTMAALEGSQFLIVLCSPNAANSKYVNEEIRHFKAMGRSARVIPVIVEGEPGSADAECFPQALRFKLNSDGALSDEREEPIAADARPGHDGKDIAKEKIIAGLLGVGLDEIMRRAEQARRRRALIRNAIIALLAVLTVASGAGFFWARYELARNEELLDRTLQRATAMVNQAVQVSQQFGVPHTVSLGILQQAEGLFRDMSELGREMAQLRYRKANMLIEFARNYAILGNTQARDERALEAYKLLAKLVAEDPSNRAWQNNLATAETELGNALVTEGKLGEALDRYRAALAIRKTLVAPNQGNVDWQISLANLDRAIGVVLTSQGKSADALASYQAGITIVERLAAADPNNVAFRRDLALDHYQIGDVLRLTNKLGPALQEFRISLDLRQQLVTAAPDDPNAQINLSLSYSKVGDVFGAQSKFADALENQRDALAIRERVAATDRTNAVWQRDLLWAYSRIGDVLRVQGNLDEALANDQKAATIAERLATADPSNNAAQRELSSQDMKLGDVHREQEKYSDALNNYQASLAISQRIAAADPSNGIWRCEITMRYNRMGDVLMREKKFIDALASLRKSIEIMQPLSAEDQSNSAWLGQLSITQFLIGSALQAEGKDPEALESYRASLAGFEHLLQGDPDNPFYQRWVARLEDKVKEPIDAASEANEAKLHLGLRPDSCGVPPPAFGEF